MELQVRGGLTLEYDMIGRVVGLIGFLLFLSNPEMIQRVIVHPSFKNCSFDEAEKALSKMDQGETIFRPSSKVSSQCQWCSYMCTCMAIILLLIL